MIDVRRTADLRDGEAIAVPKRDGETVLLVSSCASDERVSELARLLDLDVPARQRERSA